jgi:hypothetical protein
MTNIVLAAVADTIMDTNIITTTMNAVADMDIAMTTNVAADTITIMTMDIIMTTDVDADAADMTCQMKM